MTRRGCFGGRGGSSHHPASPRCPPDLGSLCPVSCDPLPVPVPLPGHPCFPTSSLPPSAHGRELPPRAAGARATGSRLPSGTLRAECQAPAEQLAPSPLLSPRCDGPLQTQAEPGTSSSDVTCSSLLPAVVSSVCVAAGVLFCLLVLGIRMRRRRTPGERRAGVLSGVSQLSPSEGRRRPAGASPGLLGSSRGAVPAWGCGLPTEWESWCCGVSGGGGPGRQGPAPGTPCRAPPRPTPHQGPQGPICPQGQRSPGQAASVGAAQAGLERPQQPRRGQGRSPRRLHNLHSFLPACAGLHTGPGPGSVDPGLAFGEPRACPTRSRHSVESKRGRSASISGHCQLTCPGSSPRGPQAAGRSQGPRL